MYTFSQVRGIDQCKDAVLVTGDDLIRAVFEPFEANLWNGSKLLHHRLLDDTALFFRLSAYSTELSQEVPTVRCKFCSCKATKGFTKFHLPSQTPRKSVKQAEISPAVSARVA